MIRFLRNCIRRLEPFSFALLCGLFAGALLSLWGNVLNLPLSLGACLAFCVLVCVLLRLVTLKWQVTAVTVLLLLLSLGILIRYAPKTAEAVWEMAREIVSFSWNYLAGAYAELTPLQQAYLPYTALLMGAAFSIGACLCVLYLPAGFPAMAAALAFSAWNVFTRNRYGDLAGFLTALAALLSFLPALFARRMTDEKAGRQLSPRQAAWYIIPFTFLFVFLFSSFVPKDTSGMYLPVLRAPVQDIASYMDEKNGVTVRRTDSTFTYRAMGYGDESTGSLGGTLLNRDTPYLKVTARQPQYLKGSVYDTYTGKGWKTEVESASYRVGSRLWKDKLGDVMDLIRPNSSEIGEDTLLGFWTKQTVHITQIPGGSTGTVFTHGRVVSVRADSDYELVPRFNMAGEIYHEKNLAAGTGYTVTAYVPLRTEAQVRSVVLKARKLGLTDTLDHLEWIRSHYLALPDSVPEELYRLAEELTYGKTNEYDKVASIQKYLAEQMRYTMDPAESDSPDFVAGFLETGEGYCTYYASALAVLSRCAGIPSRYVEGFRMAKVYENGTTLTGNDAHAWTEIYFNGIGWLIFDPTPEAETGPLPDRPDAPDAPVPSEDAQEEEEAEELPDILPGIGEGEISPGWILALVFGSALVTLCLAVFLILRHKKKQFTKEGKPFPPVRQAERLYADMERLFALLALKRQDGETLREHLVRCSVYPVLPREELPSLVSALEGAIYGNAEPEEETMEKLQKIHADLQGFVRRQCGLRKYLTAYAARHLRD